MAVELQYTQVVGRPVDGVFDFMVHQHARNHPRWDSDIELELVTDGPIGVGTIFRRRNSRSGTPVEGTMEVVKFEPNQRFEVVIREGPGEWRGWIAFEALDASRTKVTRGFELPGTGESIDRSLFMSRMEETGHEIKRLIESEVAE
jgi:hypothetical protein